MEEGAQTRKWAHWDQVAIHCPENLGRYWVLELAFLC